MLTPLDKYFYGRPVESNLI